MLLSVIIPSYNSSETIGACLKSILSQAFDDYEILVIDASPDHKTISAIPSSPKIRVFSNCEKGTNKQVWRGVVEARGEYVGFVDSDDVVAPDLFGQLLYGAQRFHCDIAACAIQVLDSPDVKAIKGSKGRWKHYCGRHYLHLLKDIYCTTQQFSRCAKVIRKTVLCSALKRYPSLPKNWWEDTVFTYEVFLSATSYASLNSPLYGYVTNPKSTTHQVRNQQEYIEYIHFLEQECFALFQEKGKEKWSVQFQRVTLAVAADALFCKAKEGQLNTKETKTLLSVEFPLLKHYPISNVHHFGLAVLLFLNRIRAYGLISALYNLKHRSR